MRRMDPRMAPTPIPAFAAVVRVVDDDEEEGVDVVVDDGKDDVERGAGAVVVVYIARRAFIVIKLGAVGAVTDTGSVAVGNRLSGVFSHEYTRLEVKLILLQFAITEIKSAPP